LVIKGSDRTYSANKEIFFGVGSPQRFQPCSLHSSGFVGLGLELGLDGG
jgi:hypothetical protein